MYRVCSVSVYRECVLIVRQNVGGTLAVNSMYGNWWTYKVDDVFLLLLRDY